VAEDRARSDRPTHLRGAAPAALVVAALSAPVLVALAALAAPAWATTLLAWDLAELARRADVVVIGTVTARATSEVERTLMTDTYVRVERVLRGEPTPAVTVRQLGGKLGRRVVDVPGDAVLEVGQRYVLFTHAPGDGRTRYLMGMALGALRLEGDEGVQQVDVPLLSSTGELTPPPGARRVPLAELERVVRSVGPR
jgi:hypothetical protein